MGSGKSTPQQDNTNSRQIQLELQKSLENLEQFKNKIETSAYHTLKNQISGLQLKFGEFYKLSEINNLINSLITANVELENTLRENKKELLKCEKEKDELGKRCVQKEQDLRTECKSLEHSLFLKTCTVSNLEICINEHENKSKKCDFKIESLNTTITVLQSRVSEYQKEVLKHQSEKELLKKQLHEKDMQERLSCEKEKDLQSKYAQLQRNLSAEIDAKKALQKNITEHKEKIVKYEEKVNELISHLSQTESLLIKSKQNVKLLERLRQNLQMDLKQKQKALNDNSKELMDLRTCYQPTLGSTNEQEIERELDKLGFNFILSCQNNLNGEISSNPKQEKINKNYDKKIEKYQITIKELKNELRSSDMKFQYEEKRKMKLEGKLFLIEEHFHNLKTFCGREFKNKKDRIKKATERGSQDNQASLESNGVMSLENKTEENNSKAVPEEGKLSNENMFEARFCTNQETELNSLHKEFETIFTRIK